MYDIGKILPLFLILILLSFGVAHAGLVAYYPFDGNTNDVSGNGKNGVYWSDGSSTATPTFVTGARGQAISLREFASYNSTGGAIGSRIHQGVVLPSESYFDFVNGASIAYWVKFNSTYVIGEQGYWVPHVAKSRADLQYQVGSNWNTGAQRLFWRVAHTTNFTSTFTVKPGTTDERIHLCLDEEGNPDYDIWYHVVTTYDSSTGLSRIYLDGVLNMECDTSNNGTIGPRAMADRTGMNEPIGIGFYVQSNYVPYSDNTTAYNSHDGLIDEVAIFDHVLTPQAVQMLYQYGNLCLIEETDGSTDVDEKALVVPATDEYKIVFMTPPTSPVTITVGGYDTDQISVYPQSTVVSSLPWECTFTVTAINDPAVEGFQTTDITHTVASADSRFNWGYDPDYLPDVLVNIYEGGIPIHNGGFELPDVQDSPPDWMAIPTGWQTTGAAGIRKWDSGSGDNQILFSLGRGEFHQDTNFVFMGGKTYVLCVDIGQFENSPFINYFIQLRDVESDTVWAEADQDDFGYPGPGAFDLTGSLSYTTPASGGPVGKRIRVFLRLGNNGVSFDNVALYLVTDPTNLTMAASPTGMGIDTIYPPVGQATFIKDSCVAIKAADYYGWPEVYKFDHWVGQGVTDPNASHTTVLMDQDRSLTAVYVDARAGDAQWHNLPVGDLNQDSFVDIWDLVTYVENWLNNENH